MLSGLEIKRQVELGNIIIEPFDERQLNPNSYNIKLGNKLKVYKTASHTPEQIEARVSEKMKSFKDKYSNMIQEIRDLATTLDKDEFRRSKEKEYDSLIKEMEDAQIRYRHEAIMEAALDPKKDNETVDIEIPEEGYVLLPGVLYLGTTEEYTETYGLIPGIDGRSTTGRLGIEIHRTAGFGDIGFKGKWTLEITCIHPVIIYPGMEIGQIYYENIEGDTSIQYNGKYQNQMDVLAAKVDKTRE